ncbi:MAG: cupin domain-containing protein [Alphaproteobacteria bacterium]|nr:cupin domain-containing protein [Alphaproteobacteria bacterium]MBU1527099.1 cupin domain-containing protein [Alphaproteobacteria bacterium]MBU2116028.1 cupin domain-containing protein [Alphaproteobacteria bacterium]MBU2350705.1 cupin domain-containing protein [Alphaproteobacteria bacterium]MBU2383322.1 cupin domain-containing protein [Alphaproteobacteria bacterium]
MRSLDDLLAPITPEAFHRDFDDRKPLHVPADAGASKRSLLGWDDFNALLDQSAVWTATTLKMVHDNRPIPPEQYCVLANTQSGMVMRPSPAKVQALMAAGASVILGDVESLTPGLRALSADLSRRFAAQVGVNLYCSFGGVQAFGSHYDLHHVFAVQVEGEKTWRLYSNREADPVDLPDDSDGRARERLHARRGQLVQEIRMKPGDVLYLPRGQFHDALATEGASLHATFSVTPLYGRILFRLLESAAMQDPAFRRWLRPAGEGAGVPLKAQLADLGARLAALAASPAFADEIAMSQTRLTPRAPAYGLPERTALTFLAPTGLAAPPVSGPAAVAMDWALGQPRIALEDMIAQFDFVPEADLRAAVDRLIAAGALRRV